MFRGDVFCVLKDVSEITLVAEATGIGNLGEGLDGSAEKIGSEIDAALAEELSERTAGAFLEQAGEMAR